MRKTVCGFGIFMALAIFTQAGETMVEWGDTNGDTTITTLTSSPFHDGNTSGATYVANAINSPTALVQDEQYYPNRDGHSPNYGLCGIGASTISRNRNYSDGDVIISTSPDEKVYYFIYWDELLTVDPVKLKYLTIDIKLNNSGASSIYRFAVQTENSIWYVSDKSNALTDSYLGDTTFDVDKINWHSYDPTTDISIIGASVTPDFKNEKIKTVAFLLDTDNPLKKWFGPMVRHFKAEARDPEPNAKLFIINN